MVHALKEAWRVLKQEGILIDLRPIAVDTPLLILTRAGWQPAGMPDQSPDRIHDNASDRAMRSAVADQMFIKLKQSYFNINYYWNDVDECKADIHNRWKEDILVPDETWQMARSLFTQGDGPRRVRFPFRKKITIYQKMLAG